MKTALIFLTTGFEEMETIAPIDVLRRGGVDIKSVSLEPQREVTGAHQVPIIADVLFDEIKDEKVDILILPGGSKRISEFDNLKTKINATLEQGNSIAAICAAPMVFGQMDLLKNKKAIAYPGFEEYLTGAEIIDQPVVVDGNIITAKGPATAVEFALTIVEHLTDKETRHKVEKEIIYS